MFPADLTRFVGAARDSGTASQSKGLDLVSDEIDIVIKQIEAELAELQPVYFAFAGLIQETSFGGAEEAPNLSLHYGRAHDVTWKTLMGLKEDLEAFQVACRRARQEIVAADEDVAQRHARTREAVELLEVGASSDQGRRAWEQAREEQDVDGGGDR